MKVRIEKVMDDLGIPSMGVVLFDLTPRQIDLAFDLAQKRLAEIWLQIPVCGGDVHREENWAMVLFDYGWVVIEDGVVTCHIELKPDCPEDELDVCSPGYWEIEEHSWMKAIPFGKDFIEPLESRERKEYAETQC